MRIFELIAETLTMNAPHTRRTYGVVARAWIRHLSAINSCRALSVQRFVAATPREALSYVSSIRDAGASDAKVRLHISALSTIYQRLIVMGHCHENPFQAIRRMATPRQQVQVRPTALISSEKVQALLDAPSAFSKAGRRDRALLALLFGCGLRRSEVQALAVADVGVSPDGTLFVILKRTKAGKRANQPLPPWAGEAFSVLVAQRKTEGAENSDALFVRYSAAGRIKGPCSDSWIYRRFRYWCAHVGVSAAPHAARRTAATMLHEMGFSLLEIARFLRHSGILQVQKYVELSDAVEKNAGVNLNYRRGK